MLIFGKQKKKKKTLGSQIDANTFEEKKKGEGGEALNERVIIRFIFHRALAIRRLKFHSQR